MAFHFWAKRPRKPFPAIEQVTAWEVLEHSSERDGTGLAFFSCPRSMEEKYPLSQQPTTVHYPLSGIGRITFTTIQNNCNPPRIFSFRANLQTPKFVSMPSCATMKSNRRVFPGRKSETAQLSGFKTCNSFPFSKALKKIAHFSAVLRPASQPHPLNRGAIEREAMKFFIVKR